MAANDVPCCEPMFWVYLIICIALVTFAGLMSGLTLGLMSLSLVDLEVLAKSGQPRDRRNAEKILPLVRNQHLLLCTLLIYNAMAMEALPIFVDALLPAWGAILISVTLILAFGEIIPQAVCSRYGLSVGAKLSVLVRLLVIVLLPISYPISKLLDRLLGKDHTALLGRSELKTFVDLHANEAGKGGDLTHDETTIISGALDLTEKTAKDAMTSISKVFSLDINAKFDKCTMDLIMRKGHSRVPVYSGSHNNIIGLILVKTLICCRPEDETPIRNLTIRNIPRLNEQLPLYSILNLFRKDRTHMGVVVKRKQDIKGISEVTSNASLFELKTDIIHNSDGSDVNLKGTGNQFRRKEHKKSSRSRPTVYSTETNGAYGISNINNGIEHGINMQLGDEAKIQQAPDPNEEIIGIITMEDVMEELIQEEIYDETDEYVDIHNRIQINMLPVIRSSPRSTPGVASVSQPNWKSPFISPLSSNHNTPMLQSPTQAYVPSPLLRPTLLSSPMRSRIASPSSYNSVSVHGSPVKQAKSYEKLHQPGHS